MNKLMRHNELERRPSTLAVAPSRAACITTRGGGEGGGGEGGEGRGAVGSTHCLH